MARPLIGRTVRRLRTEQNLSQQALATRLGISPSYLNLIEHDQRNVTGSLVIKIAEILRVDLATLSGVQERELEVGLREAFSDPLFGAEQVPDSELEGVASNPGAARAILSLYRAWRVAREDASGLALPSGRRILLPNEEARDVFHERGNYFAELESAADSVARGLNATPAETNHAIAERLRREHQVSVRVGPMEDALRRYEPETRTLTLSEQLPRESRGFQMAFQLILLEARDMVEALLARIAPTTPEAASLIRIGLLNYAAAALLMPYPAFLDAARVFAPRHGRGGRALLRQFRTGVSPPLDLATARGARRPFFFLRLDPAGNVSKRFSAGGFPFARYGGSCPRWVVHAAFATPGTLRVQVAQLNDGATFLCFARCIEGAAAAWGEPPPTHVVAMGCDIGHAPDVVYADGLNLEHAAVGIGLSCRLCDRPHCRSRAFSAAGAPAGAGPEPGERQPLPVRTGLEAVRGWRWTRTWRATALYRFEPASKR